MQYVYNIHAELCKNVQVCASADKEAAERRGGLGLINICFILTRLRDLQEQPVEVGTSISNGVRK